MNIGKGSIVEHKNGMLAYVNSYTDKELFVSIRRDVAKPGHYPDRIIVQTDREWLIKDVRLLE